MSASTYHEDHCDHIAWTCQRGWHECTDCQRGLGTRDHKLEAHAAEFCDQCPVETQLDTPVPAVTRKFKGPGRTVTKEEIRDAVVEGVTKGFITKDSGQREEYASGMVRDVQENKPRFDLLLQEGVAYEDQFLTRFAALLGRGAEKYGERNWQLANSQEELARFRASAMRHLFQWASGEVDEDHAAAVAFNLMAFEYLKGKLENGTRD